MAAARPVIAVAVIAAASLAACGRPSAPTYTLPTQEAAHASKSQTMDAAYTGAARVRMAVMPSPPISAEIGLPLQNTQDNLTFMTQAAQKAGAKVLLVGMQVPPNYGTDYANRFAALFETVAKAQKAAVVPFFLKGVADGADPTRMFQPDRIHPKAEAHPLMLANVWPELKKLLR